MLGLANGLQPDAPEKMASPGRATYEARNGSGCHYGSYAGLAFGRLAAASSTALRTPAIANR